MQRFQNCLIMQTKYLEEYIYLSIITCLEAKLVL